MIKMSEIWYQKINDINEMILDCEIGKDERVKQLIKKKAALCVAYCRCLENER